MRLKFLGTCGGRYATGRQLRKTGGFIVETQKTTLHVDPGPGALFHANTNYENTQNIDAVAVTHAHLDHSNDVEPVIELITECNRKPGRLIASKSCLKGTENIDKVVSDYHQSLCKHVHEIGSKEIEIGGTVLKSHLMDHDDPTTSGFILEAENGKKTGVWPDSNYSEGLAKKYENCDTIVVYCTVSHSRSYSGHTSISDLVKLDQIAEPKNMVLTHFGYKILEEGIEEQKQWIKGKTTSNIVFAEDGTEFPGNTSLSNF